MPTLLSAHEITVLYGERAVLDGVSLTVQSGERLALLGRNGAGKTTLLRVLAGELRPDEGELWRVGGLRVAVLAQHHAYTPGRTVRDLVDAAHPYREAEGELLALEADLGDPARLAAWTELHARLEAAESFGWPSRVRRILGRLDLTRFLHREAATLSGGEKTRLALALALAREPDLLILDEPTNHLDIRMREWLEGWLLDFRGAVILTSHDRDFLDAAAGRSLWLEGGTAQEYAGGYSRARAQRDLERRTQAKAARLGQREQERLRDSVDWLDRRGARSAALKTRAERVEVTEAPLPERQLRMRLLSGTARARVVAWGEGIWKTYGGEVGGDRTGQPPLPLATQGPSAAQLCKSPARGEGSNNASASAFADPPHLRGRALPQARGGGASPPTQPPPPPTLQNAAFKLRQGDRVALMGANGTGKTTLLKLLAGELFPDQPQPGDTGPPAVLQVAAGVTVASLDQTWHGLTPGQPLRAQFEARFGKRAKALLGGAGFTAADWPKTPEQLSGGERARAGLALVSGLRADLLLLDEPTNHLDVEALQALEDAVHAYAGAVVIVTHDRRFAREVANRLWVIENAELREVSGWNSREYRDPARTLEGDPPPPPPPPTPRQQLAALEAELVRLRAALDAPGSLTGREEARLRSRAHEVQHALYDLYAAAFAAPQFDGEVRSGPLRVRAQRLGERGGMFWAAQDEECPHLAWDGETLRPSAPAPAWYGGALLAGALHLLFLRWNVGKVRLGEGGRVLTRREWFELEGYVT